MNSGQPPITNVRLSLTKRNLTQPRKSVISAPSQLETTEDKARQHEQLTTIEASLDQLKEENNQLRLTIEKLKSDLEGVQFVVAVLTELDVKLQNTEAVCTRVSNENADLKAEISTLKARFIDLDHRQSAHSATSYQESSAEQREFFSDITIRGTELQTTSSSAVQPSDEAIRSHLSSKSSVTNPQNVDLAQLKSEIASLAEEVQQLKSSHHSADSIQDADQERLNCNIVIRGADVATDTPESELRKVFSGLRDHLGVADIAEFEPVSIQVINTNFSKNSKASKSKPVRVQFQSSATKKKFLQVRRIKKSITQIDIGIKGGSSNPILITEELTRSNQELLFNARSLRNQGNFKFVWSCNGQVLVRFKKNSKVIRITGTAHVNQLRASLDLQPLPEHGRCHPGEAIGPTSDNA